MTPTSSASELDPFSPAALGPVRLRNHIIKAATFEGMAPENVVTDELIDFHRALGDGGVGMTTLAFCAVSEDGRGPSREIVVRPDALPGLQRFTEAMHQAGTAASIQLGHAGPVAAAIGRRGLAPSRVFAPTAMRFTKAVTESDIARITADYGAAARIAADAGFDAIELHFGHGYLISSFLSPRMNKRTDRWGGSVENRARFAREVASAVREAVGTRLAVTAKLNMADGVPGGMWLHDGIAVAWLLEADGTLDALELTGGSSFRNVMYMFRGEPPIEEMAAAMPQPLRLGFKLAANRLMPPLPFEEAYFLPYARQFRAALAMPLILLGGINRIQTVRSALAEGFEFVAMGRALLREPDLIQRWQQGSTTESLCIHCNKCLATVHEGTHCVLVDPARRPGYTRA